ncbi:MAG: BatA domain-containing protein [Planctomycetaceae bacterium]
MGISFLAPLLLGAAALVAVPIALHLVMRRKPVPHPFPALRFLVQRAVANRRRLQLSHLLLLLLRVAALALLALAFARPVLRGASWLVDREAPVAAAFVFDTAPRMLLREGNRTRLEQAAAMAQVLFGKLPPGSSVAVLDTGGSGAAFAPSLAAAQARVERLAVATPALPLAAAIPAGARLLAESDKARRELYVFTDCSHGAWDGAAPVEVGADTSVLYVDVGANAPQNFAIESLELGGEQLAAGTPLSLSVSLARSGPDANRAVAVELLTPDRRYARRAVKPVAWKEGVATQVDFEITGLEAGVRQGRVVIDGADDLEADDARSFTVAVGAAAPVIVAAPAPAGRTGMFVAEALAPAALRRAGTARFAPTTIAVEDLGATDWRSARGIVLVDPPPLPSPTWEALGEWVAAGHGLVVWLGPRAGTPERFDSEASRRVLGGRLVRVWREPGGGNHLAPAALDHPILAAFRRVGDAVPWQDFPVLRHWEFAPEPAGDAPAVAPEGEAGPRGATPVAAYRDGVPAILEHRLGTGTVVIVTTPASQAAGDPDAWNTLATGFEPWPFVILANETLLHAIDTADERNVVAGRPAVLRIDRRDVAAAFVRTPGGDDFPAAVDQKRGTITVTATEQPGNYTIRSGGDVGGIATGFSANLAPAATDYRRVTPADLATVLGAGHRLARTEPELVRDVNLERVGTELYGWVIVLAALAMAADWIVANRFYAPRDDAEAGPTAAAAFAAGPAATAQGGPVVPPPVPPPPAPPAGPQAATGRRGPPPVPPLPEARA